MFRTDRASDVVVVGGSSSSSIRVFKSANQQKTINTMIDDRFITGTASLPLLSRFSHDKRGEKKVSFPSVITDDEQRKGCEEVDKFPTRASVRCILGREATQRKRLHRLLDSSLPPAPLSLSPQESQCESVSTITRLPPQSPRTHTRDETRDGESGERINSLHSRLEIDRQVVVPSFTSGGKHQNQSFVIENLHAALVPD